MERARHASSEVIGKVVFQRGPSTNRELHATGDALPMTKPLLTALSGVSITRANHRPFISEEHRDAHDLSLRRR
jgi:hypothetical protein